MQVFQTLFSKNVLFLIWFCSGGGNQTLMRRKVKSRYRIGGTIRPRLFTHGLPYPWFLRFKIDYALRLFIVALTRGHRPLSQPYSLVFSLGQSNGQCSSPAKT